MDRILRKIGIDAIDSRNQSFSMTFYPNLDGLMRSIGQVGLLQPIIVREKSRGSWPLCTESTLMASTILALMIR